MRRKWVAMVGMMLMGGALGVAHAAKKLTPNGACKVQCYGEWVTCNGSFDTGPGIPSIPGGPNPNGGAETNGDACDEQHSECVKSCNAKYPDGKSEP